MSTRFKSTPTIHTTMPTHSIAALLVVAALSFSPSCLAAYKDFFSGLPATHMTNEDFTIARKAINGALDDGQVGNTYRWENPGTGANGSVTLKKTFSRDGMSCKNVDFVVSAKGRKNAGPWNVCKTADGWKVVD
jgi:surface antigen